MIFNFQPWKKSGSSENKKMDNKEFFYKPNHKVVSLYLEDAIFPFLFIYLFIALGISSTVC